MSGGFMKSQRILFGVIGFMIGVMITSLVAGYAVNHGDRGLPGMIGMDSDRMAGGAIDRRFIEQMIPHHESAIAMAKLADQKSTRAEIKTLAGSIITSQTG
jgi:uncharacterized protein (DUF305 family)